MIHCNKLYGCVLSTQEGSQQGVPPEKAAAFVRLLVGCRDKHRWALNCRCAIEKCRVAMSSQGEALSNQEIIENQRSAGSQLVPFDEIVKWISRLHERHRDQD